MEATKPKKSASKAEKEAYAKREIKFDEDFRSYRSVKAELEVVGGVKGYHYFKKAWKCCISEANGEIALASKFILNIESHCRGKCTDLCFWHEKDEEQSFGPFASEEAVAVIHSFCERWGNPDLVTKYINSDTTNHNEYVNSLEGLFNLKIKHNTTPESYDLIAFYVSALANMGPSVESEIVKQLGLPFEATQELALKERLQEFQWHRDRKQSEEYKAQRAELTKKRKNEAARAVKDKSYQNNDEAQKHVQSLEEARKRAKADAIASSPDKQTCVLCNKSYVRSHKCRLATGKDSFETGDLVFVKYCTIHYYGIVLEMHNDGTYTIYFIDNMTETEKLKELKLVSAIKSEARCWVPVSIKTSSVSFAEFPREAMTTLLLDYDKKYVRMDV